MTYWKNKGTLDAPDNTIQRTNFGTVGADQVVPKSLGGHTSNAIIDDANPAIRYGVYKSGTAIFTDTRSGSWDYDGSTTWFKTVGGAAVFTFDGTSIAVMARTNTKSGAFNVYIDDVLSKGRILVSEQLSMTIYTISLNATDTSIVLVSVASIVGTAGEVMIGSERITFTGITGTTLTGCTRGANGSSATIHSYTENVYMMDYYVPCWLDPVASLDFSNGQIVYYNPFLQPGHHKIVIVSVNNPSAAQQGFWFDGFIVGTLLGARQINRQVGTVTITVQADAQGYADLGAINTTTGTAIVGLLGYYVGTSGAYPRLMCFGNSNVAGTGPDDYTFPAYAISGATPANWCTITLVFTFIGESI